jgi:cyclophilin family peptidyl-prolyl cis-trans isomerase
VIAPLLALFALAADPAIPEPVAVAPGDGISITLTPADRFYEAGKPVRVRVAIENAGSASLRTENAALFGVGFTATGADGKERAVPDSAAPANARQQILIPAGTTLSTTIDLAPLLPDVLGKRGKVKVAGSIAGVAVTPLELEIHPDWRGWHAVIETSLGEIEVALDAEHAPITTANFLELAESGFYDGLTFHRVVKGFMIQGGCPNGDGTGDGPRKLPLEASRAPDAPKHERGTISMAHKADLNSGSCQFFVCLREQPALNGTYSAFGKVVRGTETLDKIEMVPCAMVPGGPDNVPSRPKEKVTINKVRPVAPQAGRPGGSGG